MATNSYLVPGVDLLSVDCITKSDVQQAIAQAQPQTDYGFVILSATAPDVATYPALARFLWLQTSGGVAIKKLYYYNGSSWALLFLITAADILDGSIPFDKLDLTGAAPYNIIQVDASGTALGFVTVVNAITNGTIPLTKLVPAAAGNYVLTSIGSTWVITSFASLPALFTDNSIPVQKLVRGGPSGAGLLLFTSADGTTVTWSTFDAQGMIAAGDIFIAKLANSIDVGGPVGASGQSIRRNLANNAWEFYAAQDAADVAAAVSAALLTVVTAIPATFAAPQAAISITITGAKLYTVALKCTSDDLGFAVNDEVPLHNFHASIGGGTPTEYNYFTELFTANTLRIKPYSGDVSVINPAGTPITATPVYTKWQIVTRYFV